MPNYPRGPLSRVYGKAKVAILDGIENQERNVSNNRRYLPYDFPVPAKLLATPRSRENLILEISPLIEKYRTGRFGKKST